MVVIRNGKDCVVSVHGLLVGDILKIAAGDQLPADCVLIAGTRVIVDESSQTGENRDIEKHPLELHESPAAAANPFLISGTMIKDGKGTAVVACVGKNSRMGRIQNMLARDGGDEATPLERKLERIAKGAGFYIKNHICRNWIDWVNTGCSELCSTPGVDVLRLFAI